MASSRGMALYADEQQKMRFQVELEFVQCLANPNYLNYLAQRGNFKEPTFINYLKYLLYWREPEYAKYLKYPQCLHMLDLLQYESFRQELMNTHCARFIEDQQLLHWQHYLRTRTKLVQEQADLISKSTQPVTTTQTPTNTNSTSLSNQSNISQNFMSPITPNIFLK
ncbi:hypothetical protein HELRODRAFT_105060 [Helobdella robusta]|uniref:Mediator of RNA polymerase II transcription subunit 31 n=1 Tax=Helobdella robusta TaxID=6412 RepID=T1EDQ2_HELRO|nr:hypothetical protein HELRODRAFT_105060 [Helobdella robusta]ESO07080.1 hypothetical protein HELRODRAFT_105060 [Helobdella robusta]